MLLGHVLINAIQTALEDAEEAFDRVRMHVTTHVLFMHVRDGFMACRDRAKDAVLTGIVGHKLGRIGHMFLVDSLLGSMFLDYRLKGVGDHIGNMEGTNATITLNKRKDRVLMGESALGLAPRLATDECLIGFNSPASRSHDAAFGLHRFANAVRH